QGYINSNIAPSFSPDGRQVLAANVSGTAQAWDAATGKAIRPYRGYASTVRGAAFSQDGRWVLTTTTGNPVARPWENDTGGARLWDAATGQELRAFRGHTMGVNPAATAVLAPDGKGVLLASQDGAVRLWDAATGQELRAFRGNPSNVYAAAFSPD